MPPRFLGRLATNVAIACATLGALGRAPLLAQTSVDSVGRVRGAAFALPSWAFPVSAPGTDGAPDSVTPRHLSGSHAGFTDAQLQDQFAVPDWQPWTHPLMPSLVAHGRKPTVRACAYCHLPNGFGRPENAMLAGLPDAYISQQLDDMKSGARRGALAGYVLSDRMGAIAGGMTPTEVAVASSYFSRLRPRQRARVVETTTIPRVEPRNGLYFRAAGSEVEPLQRRLIETPVDASRHEMHDPWVGYIAYVPPGSIARGRRLATTGARPGAPPCGQCHGPQLRGVALIPPLAGRSPSYILRQLLAFRMGTRATPASAPMTAETAALDLDDMIDAAAYAGSLKP